MCNYVSNQKSLKITIHVDQSFMLLPFFWLPSFKSSLCSSMFFSTCTLFKTGKPPTGPPLSGGRNSFPPPRVGSPPSWSWNLHCDRCSETRSMHPSPSTPGKRLKKPSGSMASVDEKFYEVFNVEKCHPGWSGLHILVESGFESMINHESNQHQPMWITILSNRDPYVMVCCHNPHITGLFFIPKKSRNPLGPTVWGPFSSLLKPRAPRFRRARVLLRRRSASRCPTTSMFQCGCHPFCWTTSPAIHAIIPPKSPPPVGFFYFCLRGDV